MCRKSVLCKACRDSRGTGTSDCFSQPFTGLTWPLYFAGAGGVVSAVRPLATYGSTVVLAGIFPYCLVLILQGATMQLLPRQAYLRLSSALQVAACCLFARLYFLAPSLESHQALAAPENNALLRWLSAY